MVSLITLIKRLHQSLLITLKLINDCKKFVIITNKIIFRSIPHMLHENHVCTALQQSYLPVYPPATSPETTKTPTATTPQTHHISPQTATAHPIQNPVFGLAE